MLVNWNKKNPKIYTHENKILCYIDLTEIDTYVWTKETQQAKKY